MRIGVLLPLFQEDAVPALHRAVAAEEAGVDGAFCYDHLWPIGQPGRPALAPFPVLAAVARATQRIVLGPLVARVGLVPNEVLLAELDALVALAPDRVVAGLGTGDRLSAGENEAYGVAFPPASQRRATLRACARAASARGLPVWIGDGSPATRRIAALEGVALNLWDAAPEAVADEAQRAEVTWAGPVPSDLTQTLGALAAAGATWAVVAGPVDPRALVAAAVAAGVREGRLPAR